MSPRKKRPSTSDGLKWGEGYIREEARADGSTRYKARWYERQPDGTNKLVTLSFNRRDDAEDHLRLTARAKRDGRYVSAADITVTRAMMDYLERGKSSWKTSTYATYRQRAFTHIVPRIGTVRLVELTTSKIQHWIDQLSRGETGAKTIEESVRVLNGAMREAVRLDIIRTNPVTGAKSPTPRPSPHQTWTPDEVARVWAFVRSDVSDTPYSADLMWPALYRVALLTGMRPGETRALQWGDVDLEGRAVTVRRTITRGDNNREVVGTSTKTGRVRTVSLPVSAVNALRAWKVQQARIRLASEVWSDHQFVFTGRDGQFLGSTTWQRRHERIIKGAHVTSIGLHEMRHTFATVMLQRNTHPLVVSRILGHSKIQTTLDLYSHPDTSLMRDAIDALDDSVVDVLPDRTISDGGHG